MAKYHINTKTGEPGKCSATQGNCPFGGADEHFTSAEAAREAYEEKQGGSFVTPQAQVLASVQFLKVGDTINLKHLHSQTRAGMRDWDSSKDWPDSVTLTSVKVREDRTPALGKVSYMELTTKEGSIIVRADDLVHRSDSVGAETTKLAKKLEKSSIFSKVASSHVDNDSFKTDSISLGKDGWGRRIGFQLSIESTPEGNLEPRVQITEIEKGKRTAVSGHISALDPKFQKFDESIISKDDQAKLFAYAQGSTRTGAWTLDESSKRTSQIIPILEKLRDKP